MITFWHNPRCSKSRAGLALLQESGAALSVRRYLDDPPTVDELRAVLHLLDVPAMQMVRRKEPEFAAMGLRSDSDTETVLRALAAAPRLIERPIAIRGNRAAIGRPPEALRALLD